MLQSPSPLSLLPLCSSALAALVGGAGCTPSPAIGTDVPALVTTPPAGPSSPGFTSFVTRNGDHLMDGERELRFISFNIPCLHYNEDDMAFDETSPWRLPNEWEITDALTAVKQMGGGVVRTYVLSVRKPGESPRIPRHVEGPGRFGEDAFVALDRVLAVANQLGVRVIIPLVDNWTWWGGSAEYAAFAGKPKESFWTDPQLIASFEQTIDYVVNRTNTLTGVPYKNDKAILGWETGNELDAPYAWNRTIAAHLKAVDPNHLVIEGTHGRVVRKESVADPYLDVLTTHHYSADVNETLAQMRESRLLTRGKKPFFVGEFGFLSTTDTEKILDAIIDSGITGGLIWSLRYRNHDGGFYWHSEPAVGGRFKAYHWPGFASGAAYDEALLLEVMRRHAYEIRGEHLPPLEPPAPPVLLPTDDVTALTWQGSTGAASYEVERALEHHGPWVTIATEVTDAGPPDRPLFADNTPELDDQLFYRVRARNPAGLSSPSNEIGPVIARHRALVDELADQKLLHRVDGKASFESAGARAFKEDFSRLQGERGTSLVYAVDGEIVGFRVDAFFENQVVDLQLSLSQDGTTWAPVPVARTDFSAGSGDYGYWKPIRYDARALAKVGRFLKIAFETRAQLGRVEIDYR